jgi:hypothetical protein
MVSFFSKKIKLICFGKGLGRLCLRYRLDKQLKIQEIAEYLGGT